MLVLLFLHPGRVFSMVGDDDFLLLVESGGTLGEEAPGDLLLVLGGSPFLLEELVCISQIMGG